MASPTSQAPASFPSHQAAGAKTSTFAFVRNTLTLGFSSLGAIYGDIGTSPLYVFSSIFPDGVSAQDDILGAMSLIFWLFTLIVIIKYCVFVLHYGPNHGEGGQVAIYAKIAKALNIGPKGVVLPGEAEEDDLVLLTRSETYTKLMTVAQDKKVEQHFRFFSPSFLAKFILGCCFLGCGLVISDGLLTPTVSVLSAVEGIKVADPSFTQTVPVACVIFVLLFGIQSFGSQIISILFAPIIFVWFIIILVIGATNLASNPWVFKALNPYYAVMFLHRQGDIDVLGAVMLCVTGTEAMFADVGHFSALAVQVTLGFFVYPCLMIAYLGQTAYLIDHPQDVSNAFYTSIPGGINTGFYWFVFVFATLATIIASQALILGVFSILRQMIHIDCFPKFKVLQLSAHNYGRIYLPAINFMLMVAVICTCVGFKTSARITSAYGLGVALDFFLTTIMMSICLYYVFEKPAIFVVIFFFLFAALDGCLLVAGFKKVPHGAWFTVMIAALIFSFICFWTWCRRRKIDLEHKSRVPIKDVFELEGVELAQVQISPKEHKEQKEHKEGSNAKEYNSKECDWAGEEETDIGDGELTILPAGPLALKLRRYPGLAIMYTDISAITHSPKTFPMLFNNMIQSFPCLPNTFIFFSVRIASGPYVGEKDRVTITRLPNLKGFYRCAVKFGFMDHIAIDHKLIARIVTDLSLKYSSKSEELSAQPYCDLFYENFMKLENGDTRVLHIFGNEKIRSIQYGAEGDSFFKRKYFGVVNLVRTFFIQSFFGSLDSIFRNDALVTINKDIVDDEIIYVGSNVDM